MFRLRATLDSDGAQKGEDKTKQHPTTCSTGQASLASHPISSGALSTADDFENWTERESCDTWDGKLRQQLSRLCGGGPD